MKVLKFGGTSVGTPDAILRVRDIVARLDCPAVVVVSALGGVTDRLIALSQMALCHDPEWGAVLEELRQRHFEMVQAVIPAPLRSEVGTLLSATLEELARILQGVDLIGELTPQTSDAIVAYGERLSSVIAAALLGGVHVDARRVIRTHPQGEKHIVDFEATSAAITQTDFSARHLSVMGGFIASDVESGRTTNLGRGGSDYTAAILAAALGAEVLEIWTDVDGFLTADPRIIPTAFPIEELSYDEATELCNFGAKVVYPPTIFPVCSRNIPILVRNTFNPDGPRTIIRRDASPSARLIRGISSIGATALVTVSGLSMVGVVGVNRRIFSSLAAAGVSVFMVAQSASETSTSLAVTPSDAERACQILDREFSAEIAAGSMNPAACRTGLSTVAVVGENLRHHTGTVGRLFSVLGRNGIGINAIALGSLEMSVSFVIEHSLLRKTLSVLHDSFFTGNYEELNLFICGTGTVGDQLLRQLGTQAETLREKRGLKLRLTGVGGRGKSAFSLSGIPPEHYRETLDAGTEPGGAQYMVRRILELNAFNAVFVDCTASPDVAALYGKLLEHNVSVVTANKVAASGPYDDYLKLKELARRRGVKFLFETNVGAGLPIIGTIGDLIASGDRIRSIEAVLSGTLNYVFDTLSADIPFSQAVGMARENGYSEPDPRLDLCGLDVVRKLTILARESGYRVETADIEVDPFLPAECFEGSTEDFFRTLPALDAAFERERRRLVAEGKCFRYVAEWKDGRGRVGLREIPSGHPLYQLEGSNNIICLTTERYDAPMIIRGYGAGAAVTAAGVFADVMRVANI